MPECSMIAYKAPVNNTTAFHMVPKDVCRHLAYTGPSLLLWSHGSLFLESKDPFVPRIFEIKTKFYYFVLPMTTEA